MKKVNHFTRPLKAVRNYCLNCMDQQMKEVRLCSIADCPFNPYRFGKNPEHKKLTVKIIRQKCKDCSGFSLKNVRNCSDTKCPLYPYRMGKNPNRQKKKVRFTKKRSFCKKSPSQLRIFD